MKTLSVIILTHNEEEMLPGCLKHVSFANEVIVIDKQSTDNTVEIAHNAGAKIIQFNGEYFDHWRNTGCYHASGDWILYIDPDERITKDLEKEIASIIQSDNINVNLAAYRMPRDNYWWGKKFTCCGSKPDYVTRLFNRLKLKQWKGIIHESPEVIGEVGTLSHPLIHLTHRNLVSGLRKSYQWTNFEAQLFVKAQHPPVTWWRLAKVTLEAFLKKYIKERGYKEGTEGFIESAVQAWNRFMVYEQLWEMQQKPSLKEKYQKLDEKV